MGWLNWLKNDNGSESKVKVETESDGGTKTHYLSTEGGSRQDHTHIIVRESKDGSKSAQCVPHKSKRK